MREIYMNREEQVKRILLMPIVSSKSVKGITLAKRYDKDSEFILSEQKYNNNVDEDMSEIAIEFYKVIYHVNILNEDGSLRNDQYAGDTMNSYSQITSRVTSSESKKNEWFEAYHCLANFWILPMDVGRKGITKISKSKVSRDYMDGFLKILKERFDDYKSKYPKYFQTMEKIEDFYKFHGLEESGYVNKDIPEQITGLNLADEGIKKMQDLMKLRANFLAQKYMNELFGLFIKYGLISDK